METPDTVSFTISKIPLDLWRQLRAIQVQTPQTMRELLLELIEERVKKAS